MILSFNTDLPHEGKRYNVENRVIADHKGRKICACMNNKDFVGVVRCAGKALRGKSNKALIQSLLRKAAEGLKVC